MSRARITSAVNSEIVGTFSIEKAKSAIISIDAGVPLAKVPLLKLPGKKLEGPFHLVGDSLQILASEKERPATFKPLEYPNAILLTFERVKN